MSIGLAHRGLPVRALEPGSLSLSLCPRQDVRCISRWRKCKSMPRGYHFCGINCLGSPRRSKHQRPTAIFTCERPEYSSIITGPVRYLCNTLYLLHLIPVTYWHQYPPVVICPLDMHLPRSTSTALPDWTSEEEEKEVKCQSKEKRCRLMHLALLKRLQFNMTAWLRPAM